MLIFQTLKNSFYFGVIPKITILINVILLPVITPYLTPYDYGVWGIISSYSGILLAIAPLGLHVHLANSFFEYKKWNLVWGHILFLFLVSGTICAVIYIFIILGELKTLPFDIRFTVAICSSCTILLFGNTAIAAHLYPLKSLPKPLVFRNLCAGISGIFVSFLIIYIFRLGYWGFILGAMTSAIVGFLLFIPPLLKEHIKPAIDRNRGRILNWFRISIPIIPHSMGFLLLSSSSRIIMSWYDIPIKDIGIFSNGYIVGDYITIVSTALVTSLVPQMQKAYRNRNFSKYRHLYYLCQSLVLISIFCFACWMPQIYELLIRNASFKDSVSVASYICFANALMPFYSFVSTTVFIEKKTFHLLWLVFLPGILNVILCSVFIPLCGYKAAIYTTLLSFWSQLLIPFLSAYHHTKITQWFGGRWKLLLLFLILVCMIFISSFVSKIFLVYKIVICLIALLTCLFYVHNKGWDKI